MQNKKKEFIKNHLGADGKLIISSDLTEKQKQKFEYINSLGIDVSMVLKEREKEEEPIIEEPEAYSDDVEVLNEGNSSSNIVEDDSPVDDLDNFF